MLGRLRDSDPQPAKSGKNAPKLTWKPIIRESSPSQPSQQPETIFENRLFQEQLIKAREATVPIEVVPGDAQKLPYPTNSFDSIVGTLVLCTIPDPAKALAEIHRVCKPEGTILIFEHVRLNHLVLGKIQDWLTPVWKRLCVGCHLNRNTLETVEQAGFRVVQTTSMCRELFLVIEARIK
ncbi:class I SAM-dependent methyltransferase [Paenibacillus sp. JMULE4]|uniref:class I SAM-dependent methyltransferase n=1 Tax=Paenibacillus sp. JMULE4 TaxID=2518342 RepID=UPI0015751417|nr:class I SAM-dependent methyltransferase [Paenibacillus sp. JMULE4]NTZ19050.1 class I SAM-dependent methyltransferase [Paenibacillus sp. JMULE4]